MIKLLDFWKKYSEIIVLSILAVFVTITFFVKEFSMVILFFVFAVTMFLKTESIFYMIIFLFPFQVVYSYPMAGLVYAILMIGLFGIIKNYIVDIMKYKKKISWNIYLVFAILLVYIIIIPKIKDSSIFMHFVMKSVLAIFAYEYRDKLSFVKIIEIFALSLIMSGVMWLFRIHSEILYSYEFLYNGIIKLTGGFEHPNIFCFYNIITISGLLFCFYKKQISVQKFLIYFLGCFIFGHLAISRNFALNFVITILIFFIMLLIRDGLKSLKFILPFTAVIILICLLMFDTTNKLFLHVGNVYEFDELTSKWDFLEKYYNEIMAGQKKYDPGRFGLWYTYLRFFLDNPICIFIGRGYGNFLIGQTPPHNIVLSHLYYFGLIGCLIFAVFVLMLHGGIKLKNIFKYSEVFLMLVPYWLFLALNPLLYDMMLVPILLFAKVQNNEFKKDDKQEMYEMIEENKYQRNIIIKLKKLKLEKSSKK
ncbi:MAG: O-antigen ligase family protein [Clostridia bacterium]|nr:O-antigen ligase family protein [Clostridia bacterium]